MVTGRRRRSTVRERAQLLLAASIVIAIVLLGLSVLLNSMVFTENVSGGTSPEVAGDVTEFTAEARRNVRGLGVRINHARTYHTDGAINTNYSANLTRYSHLLAESYAETGSVFVNVSYDDTKTMGQRVVRTTDGSFASDTGQANWTMVGNTSELGWFMVNLDTPNTSRSTATRFVVTDSTGTNLTVDLRRNDARRLLVNTSLAGSTANATCDTRNDRTLLDLVNGVAVTGNCTFSGVAALDRPIEAIHVESGDAATGKFGVVVNRSDVGVGDCPGSSPCASPALWAVTVETRYETAALAHSQQHNVTVYDIP